MDVNIRNKRAVLLTGTIIPNSIYTQHTDALTRLSEYLFAIGFYCNLFKNDDVYFLENSDFNLESNADYQKLRTECSFTLLKFPRSEKFNEGKGYQEFEMMDGAVDLLKKKYTSFIKITGRYIIKNAVALTGFNCKGIVIDLNRRQRLAQTYFIYFTTQFYLDHLKGEYKNVNDNEGRFIEKVIYDKITVPAVLKHCSLFSRTPFLSGSTGSYGIVMKRNYLRVKIRNVERFFYNLLNIKAFFY